MTSKTACCPACGHALDGGARCAKCSPRKGARNKTVVVPVQVPFTGLASAEPAGDDLASLPIPDGWEITLDALEGPSTGTSFRVTRSRVLIGRGTVEVTLPDPTISRKHASLEVYGGTCVLLKDLDSTNGTFVNDARINVVELQDGDEIRIGSSRLAVTIAAPP